MKNLSKKLVLSCMTIITLFISSCSNDNNDDQLITVDVSVKLISNATHGDILTDRDGNALYFFSKDTKDTSQCADTCLDSWPVFYNENITVGKGLDVDDFSSITRTDGSPQATYKGWPLYYFSNDNTAGDTKGDGVGNVWFVAKPDYSLMYGNAQLVGSDSNNYLEDYAVGDGTTSYIVNINGRTMYIFINDDLNSNNFTASDFSNNSVWPIVELTLNKIPSILNSLDFGTIDVFGRTQLTYKGWPLYYFGQDTERGDNKGVSVPTPGVWPIVNVNTETALPDNSLTNYEVTNSGATAYVFNDSGFTNESNPNLTLTRGETYTFTVNSPGHPFIIKSIQGTGTNNDYNNGVTNNGIASGTVTFTVPSNAPDTLYYNCEFHSSMTGIITISN